MSDNQNHKVHSVRTKEWCMAWLMSEVNEEVAKNSTFEIFQFTDFSVPFYAVVKAPKIPIQLQRRLFDAYPVNFELLFFVATEEDGVKPTKRELEKATMLFGENSETTARVTLSEAKTTLVFKRHEDVKVFCRVAKETVGNPDFLVDNLLLLEGFMRPEKSKMTCPTIEKKEQTTQKNLAKPTKPAKVTKDMLLDVEKCSESKDCDTYKEHTMLSTISLYLAMLSVMLLIAIILNYDNFTDEAIIEFIKEVWRVVMKSVDTLGSFLF